jgi:hypothetical protein
MMKEAEKKVEAEVKEVEKQVEAEAKVKEESGTKPKPNSLNLLLLYDRATGEIIGRIITKNPANYKSESTAFVGVTEEEFHARPELFAKIDIKSETKDRIALAPSEIAAKIGGLRGLQIANLKSQAKTGTPKI